MGVVLLNPGPIKKAKPYAVAYLDLLGTTDKIGGEYDSLYLNQLYSIYNLAVKLSEIESPNKNNRFKNIKTKIFSDNIIIAIELHSTPEKRLEDIKCLLDFLAIFQSNAMINHAWPIRGGIALGDLFVDKLMVWGTGLVRAYKLEDKMAIFPRIFVDSDIVKEFDKVPKRYLMQDHDGQWFLDFLSCGIHYQTDHAKHVYDSFLKMLYAIRKADYTYHEKPLQKLQWYRNYINRWYSDHYNDSQSFLNDDLDYLLNDWPNQLNHSVV